MSMRPKRSNTWRARAGAASGAPRSAAKPAAATPCPWSSATAASSSACLRATKTTIAPNSPRAPAICSPRPREPPVTIATLPFRSNRPASTPVLRSLITRFLVVSKLHARAALGLDRRAPADRLEPGRHEPRHVAPDRDEVVGRAQAVRQLVEASGAGHVVGHGAGHEVVAPEDRRLVAVGHGLLEQVD